ncbi:MAG: glycogen-binding domain-containing protein [bacterium]
MVTMKKSKPKARRVTFKVRADPDSRVFVAGDFNNWDPSINPLSDPGGTGTFSAVLSLHPGAHEYKFVINGTWCVDPDCTEWVQNSLGTLNSICKV